MNNVELDPLSRVKNAGELTIVAGKEASELLERAYDPELRARIKVDLTARVVRVRQAKGWTVEG